MLLNDLHELIETLQARIATHGEALRQSEALTRYALVDPLLRALGWDTSDPAQVLPEYRSPAGSADYVLLGKSNKPQVIIEAKRLGTQLDARVRKQVTSYCQEEGVPFAVITDGKRWEIYDIFRPVALRDSMIAILDFEKDSAMTSLQALALWRPGAESGVVKPAAEPIVDQRSPARPYPPGLNERSESAGEQAESPSADPAGHWQVLAQFRPEGRIKPAALRLPDGSVAVTPNWSDLVPEIVRWLRERGALDDDALPIQAPKAKRFIVSVSPQHPNGAEFAQFRQVGSWYVEKNHSARSHIKNARIVIERGGHNPADFAVRLQ